MIPRLRRVRLEGNWDPLFNALPGWLHRAPLHWTAGECDVRTQAECVAFAFVLDRDPLDPHSNARASADELVQLPGSLAFEVHRNGPHVECPSPYLLNHVALDVADLDAVGAALTRLLGDSAVLQRQAAFDPVLQRNVRDLHLFRTPAFYITLRQSDAGDRINHVGWMVPSRNHIDAVAEVLKRIGWRIVLGPFEIDESFLIHFEGPDGRIHDFYCPAASLMARVRHER